MKTVYKILATGFGSGCSPVCPGTVGSITAAVIAWYFDISLTQIIFFSVLGVYICTKGEEILGKHDSPNIVFDEFCGLFIAVWEVDSFILYLAGFLFFRALDIIKPYPINRLQELPRGWGVMADDVAAGILARLGVVLITLLLP